MGEPDASEAEKKLKQVGGDSWAAFSKALAQSRAAFDQANHAAWEAFKRAAARKTEKAGHRAVVPTYRAKNYKGHSKDYEFSRLSMQEHPVGPKQR